MPRKLYVTIIILKVLFNLCFEYCAISFLRSNEEADMEKLRHLLRILNSGIETLESSERKIQERLQLITDVPTEENSPYKNDRVLKYQKTSNYEDAIQNFIDAYMLVACTTADILSSVSGRTTLKLLAIQRTCNSQIPLLKEEQ